VFGDAGDFNSVSTDDAVINQSVDATGLTLSGDPANPTTPLSYVGSDASHGLRGNDETVQGDNSATDIATTAPSDGVNMISAYFWVYGRRQGDFTGFFDLVSMVNNEPPNVHLQDSRNTVTRTYSESAGRLQIAIDDSGNTYDVSIQAIAADRA
jgi:hypothetical protein